MRQQEQTKEEHIEVEGRVTTVLPGTMFRVELDNKHVVLATVCGKMRKRWVRLTIGDRGLKEGKLEYQGRRDAAATPVAPEEALALLKAKLAK